MDRTTLFSKFIFRIPYMNIESACKPRNKSAPGQTISISLLDVNISAPGKATAASHSFANRNYPDTDSFNPSNCEFSLYSRHLSESNYEVKCRSNQGTLDKPVAVPTKRIPIALVFSGLSPDR